MNTKYKEDLEYFIKTYKRRSLHFISDDEITSFINNYKNDINNDYDFIYMIKSLFKKINGRLDSLSDISFNNTNLFLPVKFKFIDNNLYIVNSIDEYNNLLFSKVISINDISIIKLVKKYRDSFSYAKLDYFFYRIGSDFSNNNILSMLFGKMLDSVNLKIEVNGKIENISMKFSKYEFNDNIYSYKELSDRVVIRLSQYNKIYDIKNIIKNYKIFILDIRGNISFDDRYYDDLAKCFKNKKIIAITDNSSFIGVTYLVHELIKLNSIFIGSEIGTLMNYFYNTKKFKLPNTKLDIYYCTKFRYYRNGEIEDVSLKRDYKKLEAYRLSPVEFRVDKYIYNNIEDIKNNNDKVLEFACSYKFDE